ncbi:DUF6678 family protein [Acidovorax sp. BLS4]|uniref:DUF6678 family protein n=1 Tax=Acidovorax sp. BLS4 TaxID=3273430 RepID=UPI00355C8845
MSSDPRALRPPAFFCDCAAASPQGPGSLCHGAAAWNAQKQNKPENHVVDAAAPMTQWLQEVLKHHRIPYSVEAGVIRVWGYTRPGPQPDWRERGGGPSPESSAV